MQEITLKTLEDDFRSLGVKEGDIILGHAAVTAVGQIDREKIIEALLNVIGPQGTLVGLAYTNSGKRFPPFTLSTPSYAGAFPNMLLGYEHSKRSTHPQCSYVAVGKYAEEIVSNHNAHSGAYEPIRTMMNLGAKAIVLGCVSSCPGFTTTHLAEMDLGLHKRLIMPWLLFTSKYIDENNQIKVFKRKDKGLCSKSYWKFYAYYVKAGVLKTGLIGEAFSILCDMKQSYSIEKTILKNNPRFNICESPNCFLCNAGRWDRLHYLPNFVIRYFFKRVRTLIDRKKM